MTLDMTKSRFLRPDSIPDPMMLTDVDFACLIREKLVLLENCFDVDGDADISPVAAAYRGQIVNLLKAAPKRLLGDILSAPDFLEEFDGPPCSLFSLLLNDDIFPHEHKMDLLRLLQGLDPGQRAQIIGASIAGDSTIFVALNESDGFKDMTGDMTLEQRRGIVFSGLAPLTVRPGFAGAFLTCTHNDGGEDSLRHIKNSLWKGFSSDEIRTLLESSVEITYPFHKTEVFKTLIMRDLGIDTLNTIEKAFGLTPTLDQSLIAAAGSIGHTRP